VTRRHVHTSEYLGHEAITQARDPSGVKLPTKGLAEPRSRSIDDQAAEVGQA
jgi:hypothetical protein